MDSTQSQPDPDFAFLAACANGAVSVAITRMSLDRTNQRRHARVLTAWINFMRTYCQSPDMLILDRRGRRWTERNEFPSPDDLIP